MRSVIRKCYAECYTVMLSGSGDTSVIREYYTECYTGVVIRIDYGAPPCLITWPLKKGNLCESFVVFIYFHTLPL